MRIPLAIYVDSESDKHAMLNCKLEDDEDRVSLLDAGKEYARWTTRADVSGDDYVRPASLSPRQFEFLRQPMSVIHVGK